MSDPIEHRLRDSLSRHAAAANPTADGWTAIRDRAEHAHARRRRTFRLAAAGALAAVIAVAVPLTLDRVLPGDIAFETPPPITAETATPTPSPTPTSTGPSPAATTSPAPVAVPIPAAQVWTAAEDAGALSPAPLVSIEAVVSVEAFTIAVGSFSTDEGARQAAIWTGLDGDGWTLLDDPELLGGQPDTYTDALDVAWTDHGLVAVGATYSGDEIDIPLVWTNPTNQNPERWRRATLPGDGRARAVTEVTPGDPSAPGDLVVVGGYAPTIWTSRDGGANWETTSLEPLDAEDDLNHVVSVGSRVVAMGPSSVVVSEDAGGSWTQIPLADAGLPQGVADVVALPDGSLLGIVATDQSSEAYVSADGRTWELAAPFPRSPAENLLRVSDLLVTRDDTLILAGGSVFDTDAGAEVAAVWISRDRGRSWVRDEDVTGALAEGTLVTALTSTELGLFALGDGPVGEGTGGRAWSHPYYP